MSTAPWERGSRKQLAWRDAVKDAPSQSGYYAITTDSDPIRAHFAYYNHEEFEWDFMPPRAAMEWLIEPTLMAVIQALRTVLDKKAMKAVDDAMYDLEIYTNEYVEGFVLEKLAEGYDTGANKMVSTWCEMPEPGLEADDETGAEIVQIGSLEAAESLIPHLQKAIAAAIRTNNKGGGEA